MKTYVNIKRGMYRIHQVSGRFEVKERLKTGAKGNYIAVRLAEIKKPFEVLEPRIRVESTADFEYCTSTGEPIDDASPALDQLDFESQLRALETEPEAMDRMRTMFAMANDLVIAAAEGVVRGLVISGPPGCGKSYGVNETLERINMQRKLSGLEPNFEMISGISSAIRLYQTLYNNRHKHNVVLFNDCDCILEDMPSLSVLKPSLDSGKNRVVSWNTESTILERAEVPDSFSFDGSVIFLTNVNFEHVRAGKIKEHLAAIMSRCHYLDLEISNQRDQLLRVKQVVGDGMLDEYRFKNKEEEQILDYIFDNADQLREISLRMVVKMAELLKMNPKTAFKLIEATCVKRPAKFKRLFLERTAVPVPAPLPLVEETMDPEPTADPAETCEDLITVARGPDDPVMATPAPTLAPTPAPKMPAKIRKRGARAQKKWREQHGG